MTLITSRASCDAKNQQGNKKVVRETMKKWDKSQMQNQTVINEEKQDALTKHLMR